MTGIFVMLNNLFHDLSVAMLMSIMLLIFWIDREKALTPGLYSKLSGLSKICWIVIILGGVIRTIAYRKYEWMEAAGEGQVAALVIKHLILVSAVVLGLIIQINISRKMKKDRGK